MSDFDLFTERVRREAGTYRDPPAAPTEAMWRAVEARLAEGTDGASLGRAAAAHAYNEVPATPRAEMWGRIEAALAVRGAAGRRWPVAPERWPAAWRPWRGRVAGWVAALAAAASLVLGLALGRIGRPSQPGEGVAGPEVATASTGEAVPAATPAQTPLQAQPDEPEPTVLAASIVPVPVATADPAPVVATALPDPPPPAAEDARPAGTAGRLALLGARQDDGATRYLGRAEMLLTAFGIDQRTPAGERDLARWARDLLMETRMLLDLPVSRTPEELALLRDLEVVVLQISRLGAGAPDVEWQLARESIELKDALPRLRAASATDGL